MIDTVRPFFCGIAAVALCVGCSMNPIDKDAGNTVTDVAGADVRGDVGIDARTDVAASECVVVEPAPVRFPEIEAGLAITADVVLTNCGASELEVEEFIVQGTDPFSVVDRGSFVGAVIGAGESLTAELRFEPETPGDHEDTLVVKAASTERNIPLEATALEPRDPCPRTAVDIRADGGQVDDLTDVAFGSVLEFDASASEYNAGTVETFEWKVTHPTDVEETRSGSVLEFRALTVGEYQVELDLVGDDGVRACDIWTASFLIEPSDDELLVQVVWHNADDPDETDDVGADVDLHLVKMGPGRWFEAPYDIYFRNPNNPPATEEPIWGEENPTLATDDLDGLGPEVISMPSGGDCQWYAVGVHYYRELFGVTRFDLRIWVRGALVYELLDEPIERGGDFVDVARIQWPSGSVWEVNERSSEAPADVEPAVVDEMVSSGLCTEEDLY